MTVTREEFAKLQSDLRTLARVVYGDLPFADRIYERGKELHPDQHDALAVLSILSAPTPAPETKE